MFNKDKYLSCVNKCKGDPVLFIEEALETKLTNFQKDYIRFFHKNKEKRIYMNRIRSTNVTDIWLELMFLIIKEDEGRNDRSL